MSDDPFAQPKTLKEARKTIPSQGDVQARLLACQEASDYEAALVCVSLMDHLFMQAISTKFVTLSSDRLNGIFLDGGNAPLSNFSSKIKLMHALGLFGNNTRLQCERINSIRNHFAHHKDKVSFFDHAVATECSKFTNATNSIESITPIEELLSSKFKYVFACLHISIAAIAYLQIIESGDTPRIIIDVF